MLNNQCKGRIASASFFGLPSSLSSQYFGELQCYYHRHPIAIESLRLKDIIGHVSILAYLPVFSRRCRPPRFATG